MWTQQKTRCGQGKTARRKENTTEYIAAVARCVSCTSASWARCTVCGPVNKKQPLKCTTEEPFAVQLLPSSVTHVIAYSHDTGPAQVIGELAPDGFTLFGSRITVTVKSSFTMGHATAVYCANGR